MINKDLLIIIHFTLRVYFAPTNFTLSIYFASKHFGDSACFGSKKLRDSAYFKKLILKVDFICTIQKKAVSLQRISPKCNKLGTKLRWKIAL